MWTNFLKPKGVTVGEGGWGLDRESLVNLVENPIVPGLIMLRVRY